MLSIVPVLYITLHTIYNSNVYSIHFKHFTAMSTKMALGYDSLLTQSKEQGLSPIEFIAKLDKDSYNAVIVEKNIRRFAEDINDEIRKKERIVEDLKDSIPGFLRDMPQNSAGRMDLVRAITVRLGDIENGEADIASLYDFKVMFLEAPESE